MKKYAIFGGTFDPFTMAHRAIVEQVYEQLKVDKVIVVPTIVTYYKAATDKWLTDDDRVKSCKALLDDLAYCEVDTQEVDLKKMCNASALLSPYVESRRFIDTLLNIRTKYANNNDAEFYVVIGSDQLKEFQSWHMWTEIIRLATLVVVQNRNGTKVYSALPHVDISISDSYSNVSSTELRKRYANGSLDRYLKDISSLIGKRTADQQLLHTPIFDVVRAPEVEKGLSPVKVKSPDWVTIIVRKDGQYILETQLRYGIMKDVNEFPCGMVEEGEDPQVAAARELKEETGISVKAEDLAFIGKVSPNPAFMTNTMYYYFADLDRVKYREGEQDLDTHEHIKWKWVTGLSIQKDVANKLFSKDQAQVPGLFLTSLFLLNSFNNAFSNSKEQNDAKEL